MTTTSRARPFLDRLTPETRARLLAGARPRTHRTRSTIVLDGDAALDVLVVRRGILKASTTVGGREVVLDILGPGDLAGEVAALDGRDRSSDLVTLTPATVDRIGVAAFIAFLDAHPDATRALLEEEAGRLREASRRQVEYGALDAVGRVCGRLAELLDRFGTTHDRGMAFTAPLTQGDIAAWAGLSREAVVGALRTMRRSGWVATGGDRIVVTDEAALRTRAAR